MEDIVNRLKHIRSRKGWTQESLARKVGVSLNTVQRWESGKTHPSPLAMEKLKDLLRNILDQDQLKLF
jgi:transcriptional regulator with XRE-family HTH domain